MRLLKLEFKRILKTRSTWVFLGAALFLSVLMACIPRTFVQYAYMDDSGKQITVSGSRAMEIINEKQAPYAGEVTPDKVQTALETYQACIAEYGPTNSEDFPLNVYNEKILPIQPYIHLLREVYADSRTGTAADLMKLGPEDAGRIYEQCREHLDSLMKMEQKDYPDAQNKAAAYFTKVEQPYEYYPGYNKDATDYLVLYLLLLEFICVLLAAPVFSSDYQTKADDIQRCTRHGRIRLAAVRTAVMLILASVIVAAGSGIFLLLTRALFGEECMGSSMQMLYSAVSLSDLDLWHLLLAGAGTGFLTITAAVLCTLMISSRCRSVTVTAIFGMVLCLLPVIIGQVGSGNLAGWIRCILPTGGLGLGNCFLYELFDFKFLHLGGQSFWVPHAMLAALAVEIPLFWGLTVCFYNRHMAK